MPSKSKKPQVSDLSALLKGLNEAGVEFILVGWMAAFSVKIISCERFLFYLSGISL